MPRHLRHTAFAGCRDARARQRRRLHKSTPDSENGRYTFSPTADGVLRLDTRTGSHRQLP